MVDWKSKRGAFDRAIRDYTSEPMSGILKHFPSTRLVRPNAIENNYRSPTDHYETDAYEPSNKFRNSSETSSSEYGQVARQMVTSHARSKPSGITFVGGVVQERADSKIWAGNAMSLKRSASTNDLQTQILRVTMSASTQCNENTGVSESDTVCDTDARRQNLLGSHDSSIARVKTELNAKSERYQNTADVQAQIIRVMKNASSQVGVRVMPKAIDLSRVDIDNLGLEVRNNNESTGLGLRVGQVLCPVTVGTSMDLFEGAGVQVMGINDVDSINLQLRDSVAHATTDAHRRLKVRDVQAQIVSRSNSPVTASIHEDLLDDTRVKETTRSEVQAQVGIINKAVGVQAVATMEVVNIPSQKPKKRMAENATTSLCLLPEKDTKSMGFTTSETSTSTVMTQISCLLHSRGIHSDLESYLSDYKKRNGINPETSDLCTQVQYVGKDTSKKTRPTGFLEDSEMLHGDLKSVDVETFICKVVHDTGTQVSSKLVPTEVTVGRITTKDMEVSFANPLRKVDIGVPIDSLICPAEMKFRSELYEGSDFEMVDYSGLSDILVTNDGSVARGSVMLDKTPFSSRDFQTRTTSGLKTQAAIVLRTDGTKSAVKEIVASSKCVPKMKFVVAEIADTSIHALQTSTSDLQTQISDRTRPTDAMKKSEDLDKNMTEGDNGAYGKLQSSVTFEPPVRKTSLSQGRRSSSKLTQQSFIQMIPSDQERQKSTSSDTVTQVFSILKDVSVQVGTQLVPQAIGIAPVHLKNMEISVTSKSRNKGEEALSASTLLYPAQVELKGRLMDEQSGIEVVPLDQVEVVNMNSPEVDPLIHYAHPSSDWDATAQSVTQIPESKMSNLLPASLVIETNQFDGRRRVPELASQNLVCELLSSTAKHQELSIQAKSVPKMNAECSGGRSVQQLGYLTVEAMAQTVDFSSQKIPPLDTRHSVEAQVGTRLVPKALKISQLPISNLKLEPVSPFSEGRQSFLLQAARCPAEIITKTELCEDSGIFICSLHRSGKVAVGMSDECPLMVGEEQSSNKSKFVSGCWNSSTNKSMQNATIKLPVEGVQANSSNLLSNESSLTLQAEAILRPESDIFFNQTDLISVHDPNPQFKLVLVNASTQSTSRSATEAVIGSPTPDRQLLTVNSTMANLPRPDVNDCGMQVGVRLVPASIEIKPIEVESMEAVLTNKTTLSSNKIDVSAILCASGIQYNEVLAETSGVHIVQIDNGGDISLDYRGDQFTTNAVLSKKGGSVILSIDGSRSRVKHSAFSNVATNYLQSSKDDDLGSKTYESSEFVTTLRVKGAQCSAEHSHVSGFAQDKVKLKGEVDFMRTRVKTSDKDVQVGLNLVPKAVTVESIGVENFDAVNEGREAGNTEQIIVSAMLCSKPTQYDEILTESRGVTVLPIEAAEDIQIAHDGKMHYATVESRKDLSQQGSYTGTHASLDTAYFSGSQTRIRVHHTEFSSDRNRQSIACICEKGRSKLKIDDTTQVGATFIPTQLKMQQMKLDTQHVQSLAGSLTTKTVLCPTDMSIIPILNECSGVEIAAIEGASEILIQMAQGQFEAEISDDSRSNQMCIALKEESTSKSSEFSSESIPLVKPTVRVGYTQETASLNQRTNSNTCEMSSKFVQVGTLLIPTAVTTGKVRVNNLEVEVPLSPARSSEVSVSAVLASSATELTSVLTNDSGINVIPISKVDTIGINVNGDSYVGTIDASAFTRSIGTFQKPRSIVYSSSTCAQDRQTIVIPISASNVVSSASSKVEHLLRQSKDLSQLHEALHSVQTRPILRKADSLSVPSYCRPGLLRISEQSVTPVTGSMTISSKPPTVGTRDNSYLENSTSGIPGTCESPIGPITKRLVSSASQVGTLLVPAKVCMDKIAVDQLAVDIPLTDWRTTDLSVSAILASTATEMVPVITDTTGIQIIEMKDLDELGIQVGDEVYVASVVAPPVKYVNAIYGPTRDFGVGAKSTNRKQEVVYISVPRSNETAHLTHKAKNLLSQSADLRKVHSLLQSSSFQPRLRITSKSGTSLRLTTSEPATEDSKIQESYHVACEANIEPEMLSKRLTANICGTSNDVRSQSNGAVPNVVSSSNGTTVMPGTNVNQETQHVPRAMNTRDKPVLQVGAQCPTMHRDFAVSNLSNEKLSMGEYATHSIKFGDSISQFTHQQANDMALGTLRGTSEASAICQTQKRTHSADSRTQKETEQLCVNCQNKLLMAETSVAEPYDSNSVQPAITIRRSSDVDLFGISQSTSITGASILRHGLFSRDSGKRLSGSFESLGSKSLAIKCAMCHADLTSGDLTTSIRTSTSSLLGSEAVVNMSLKEVGEAYVRICRATGQFDDFAESKERASLYQALKHNRIIQAVIADYEKDENKEGQFFLESKEIVDVVATAINQTSYCTSEPSMYSRLRDNTLVRKVVESYETYKQNQGKDSCTQTDSVQLERITSASSDIQGIAEVVEKLKKSEGKVASKGALYADLKGNPIIQRVIEEYELSKGAHTATKPSVTRVEAVLSYTAASKMGVLSVDGQVAKLESEQFASTDSLARNSSLIIRRTQKNKADEETISSSVSSDSEDEDTIQNWKPTQRSPTSLEEHIRFDVACSALIAPEAWDKKVQVDSTYQH